MTRAALHLRVAAHALAEDMVRGREARAAPDLLARETIWATTSLRVAIAALNPLGTAPRARAEEVEEWAGPRVADLVALGPGTDLLGLGKLETKVDDEARRSGAPLCAHGLRTGIFPVCHS